MEFELFIRCGDQAFGGNVTIKDFDKAPSKEVAEQALRRALQAIYDRAVKNLIEETIDG